MATGDEIAAAIRRSGISIYEPLGASPELVYPTPVLEARLTERLIGLQWNAAPRTRSKMAKTAVCEALGYEPPKQFSRERPRFPGQDVDVYVQMENNLQIWNEEVSPTRRYVLVRVDEVNRVTAVRVLSGLQVALLDRTGTLTSKYQAKRLARRTGSALVSPEDSANLVRVLSPLANPPVTVLAGQSAADRPIKGAVYTVTALFERLSSLIGAEFDDPGTSQDRLRGVAVQRLVSNALHIGTYSDNGQFPDIQSQVLEVKLQLAPTIDLGLVAPNSTASADVVAAGLCHCDIRYAVFYAERDPGAETRLRLTEVVVTTGADFFGEFLQFGGRVVNSKLQIPLPKDLFG